MANATPSPEPSDDAPAIGQLLVRLLQHFRADVFELAQASGYGDLRPVHLQVFGNLRGEGVRLTVLAERAQLSLSAMAELVDDLQQLGYLERVPDPTDGRARLIQPTDRGRAALLLAGARVAEIESRWGAVVGAARFDTTLRTLQELLTALDAPG
jgi:DNA-binding MarR family transcriptional regulator